MGAGFRGSWNVGYGTSYQRLFIVRAFLGRYVTALQLAPALNVQIASEHVVRLYQFQTPHIDLPRIPTLSQFDLPLSPKAEAPPSHEAFDLLLIQKATKFLTFCSSRRGQAMIDLRPETILNAPLALQDTSAGVCLGKCTIWSNFPNRTQREQTYADISTAISGARPMSKERGPWSCLLKEGSPSKYQFAVNLRGKQAD